MDGGPALGDVVGLSYMRGRWYDPALGRFIQEDPIHSGVNDYVFAGNDPVNGSDPSGLDDGPICVTFSTGVTQCSDWTGQLQEVMITAGGPGVDWASVWSSFVSGLGTTTGLGPSSGGSGGTGGTGPLQNLRQHIKCAQDAAVANHQATEDGINQLLSPLSHAVGSWVAGQAVSVGAGYIANRITPPTTIGAGGVAWDLAKQFAAHDAVDAEGFPQFPTLVLRARVLGASVIGARGVALAVGVNVLRGAAITAAWRSGLWIGSALVGLAKCSQ